MVWKSKNFWSKSFCFSSCQNLTPLKLTLKIKLPPSTHQLFQLLVKKSKKILKNKFDVNSHDELLDVDFTYLGQQKGFHITPNWSQTLFPKHFQNLVLKTTIYLVVAIDRRWRLKIQVTFDLTSIMTSQFGNCWKINSESLIVSVFPNRCYREVELKRVSIGTCQISFKILRLNSNRMSYKMLNI